MPHLIQSDRIIGKFGVPTGGVNQTLPAYELTTSQVRDANNLFPRDGLFRPRPGLTEFSPEVFAGTPTGLVAYYRDADAPVPVLGTTTDLYAYDAGAWSAVTGPPMTGDLAHPVRFTSIALGTPPVNYLIVTNGVDAPTQYTGTGVATLIAGTPAPPLWSDVCNIEDHIIGIEPPYGVQWSNIRALDAWPALNRRELADTIDPVVAIRQLGQGGQGVLYKQRSFWFVNYTGAFTEAQAFAFKLIGFFDGPASPAAVVDVNGSHVLMTPTGRIGLFAGSSFNWVGDLAWPKLRADVDRALSRQIFGVYDPTFQEVTFVYPSLAHGSTMVGAVIVTIPNPSVGKPESGVFPCTLSSPVTCGGTIRLTDLRDRVLLAGTSAGRSYEWTTEADQDDTTDFGGFWQTGLVPTPGMDPFKMEAVEVFAERARGYGRLDIQPVTSWTLAGDGTLGQVLVGDAGNLEKPDEPVHAATGLPLQARFFGLRCSFAAARTTTVRFKGASFFAQRKTV